MKLSEVAIRRPVFATVMSLSIILLGYISFTRLPVREYPETDPPIVSVTTIYRGRQPQRGRDRDHRRARGAVLDHRVGQDHHQQQPRAGLGDHDRVRTAPRRGRGGQRRARPRVARARAAAARGRRPHRGQGRRQRAAHHLAGPVQRQPHRRSSCPTSPTASSRSACSACRAWARSSSAASGATPCGCGSTRCAWPPTA